MDVQYRALDFLSLNFKQLIPRGRLYEALKKWRRKQIGKEILSRFNVSYSEESDHYMYIFSEGILSGMKLRLPKIDEPTCHTCIKDVISYFIRPINMSGLVIDAGTWPGDYATVAAKMLNGHGHVWSFEPNTEKREIISQTLELNNIRNVELFPYALSNANGYSPFIQNGVGSRFTCFADSLHQGPEDTVETVTLDDFCNGTRISHIKMDIEGAEIMSLDGAIDSIRRYLPSLSIASYHVVDQKQTRVELTKRLEAIGYNVETPKQFHQITFAKY